MKQPIKKSLKSLKLLSQRIKKHYYKTLGTSAINTSLSPLALIGKTPEVEIERILIVFDRSCDVPTNRWKLCFSIGSFTEIKQIFRKKKKKGRDRYFEEKSERERTMGCLFC